jgi:hypothetical protein
MSLLYNIPSIFIFSAFLYYCFSGEKSCLTLLLIQKVKALFQTKELENEVEELVKDEKVEEKVVVKYEDKYLDRFRQIESKELSEEKLESLLNSFIMENTSQGNVIMLWDNKKQCFLYYSDKVIPYRFLEVVARKYVIFNDCKKIYIDMEEQVQAAKQKLESTKESLTQNINDKEKEKEKEKQKEKQKEQVAAPMKKNVFAKMKSYNSSSIKSAVVPLDQKKAKNVQQNSSNPTPQNADAILKENANRYTYQGKLSNFSFLKKVDRKLVDKNYALSFAEFKKLKAENKT